MFLRFVNLADIKVYLLRKFIWLLAFSLILFSCKKEKLVFSAFELNKHLSCNDLYDNGFKRTFGIDVLMIGKIMNDTIVHFQISEPKLKNEIYSDDFYEEIRIENYTLKKESTYDEYLKKDALELNDSIYQLVWQNIKEQKKDICKEGVITWKNFILELDKSEINKYRQTIDISKYKILEIENPSSYNLDSFKVLNVKKKDTFYCSIYKQNEKYYMSSTISLR